MIPGNPDIHVITDQTRHLAGRFGGPDGRYVRDTLTDFEEGGIGLQDPTAGLQYQIWKGYWNSADSTAYLIPDSSEEVPVAIFTETDVVEFSFTFDQNMRWAAITRKENNTAQLRWYDSSVTNYVTTHFSGITSVKMCHDDKRVLQVQRGSSDMILTYISGNKVRWRVQRDRFQIEYTEPTLTLPSNTVITNFGLNEKLRLQWRIGLRHI